VQLRHVQAGLQILPPDSLYWQSPIRGNYRIRLGVELEMRELSELLLRCIAETESPNSPDFNHLQALRQRQSKLLKPNINILSC
jgi:hypothetical protein